MENGIVTVLASEMEVNEDLALKAVIEAEGDIDKARKIVQDLIPQFLFIKLKFTTNRKKQAGLVFLLAEKRRPEFVLFRTIAETDVFWVDSQSVSISPVDFFNMVKRYFTEKTTGSKLFDSQQLREAISKKLNATAVQYLFSLWDQPKSQYLSEEVPPEETFHQVGQILGNLFNKVLEDILIDRIKLDLDYDFMTRNEYDKVAPSLGLEPEVDKGEQADAVPVQSEKLKVCLKGQFVIDPVHGILVQELAVGDKAYVEIIDFSELAVSVGRLIGAYKMGMWRPVRCKVEEITKLTGERWKYRLKVTKGIFIETLSDENILVRTKTYAKEIPPLKVAENQGEISFIPLLAGIIVAIVLIMLIVTLQ